ncbi:MAG: hypothetical protein J6O71_02675 [Lachnospiraceae bacterium]|nr:hypothetical protein [Lachnospiraceae bacterium]
MSMMTTFNEVWTEIEKHQGEVLLTSRGLEFTYQVKGGCLYISRKKKELTKASLERAYNEAVKLDLRVSGPKKLKVFGASYIYPIFLHIGLIQKPEAPIKKS